MLQIGKQFFHVFHGTNRPENLKKKVPIEILLENKKTYIQQSDIINWNVEKRKAKGLPSILGYRRMYPEQIEVSGNLVTEEFDFPVECLLVENYE